VRLTEECSVLVVSGPAPRLEANQAKKERDIKMDKKEPTTVAWWSITTVGWRSDQGGGAAIDPATLTKRESYIY